MLEGSFWELALIFILALIVFGPERLPGMARTAGLWIGRARAVLRNLTEQLERELAAEEMRKTAADARQALGTSATDEQKSGTAPDAKSVKRDDPTG